MIHCKDCRHFDQSNNTSAWNPNRVGECGVLNVQQDRNSDKRLVWGSHRKYNSKPIMTYKDFGCAHGEEPDPICPFCDTKSLDHFEYMGMYQCHNDECRVVWFEEDSQCSQ